MPNLPSVAGGGDQKVHLSGFSKQWLPPSSHVTDGASDFLFQDPRPGAALDREQAVARRSRTKKMSLV